MPKVLYNIAMKRFLKVLLGVLLVLLTLQVTRAEEYKVLVLPDNIQFDSTNYFVYPDSSVIFASDTINELKKNASVSTVSMTEVRDTLRKNTKLNILTKKALKEFKYNYNIPFVDFKAIAHCFSTNKVLVITSQTDIQNYVLRRTIWDLLNVPGAAVVDPAYKFSTYVALIDVDKEMVLWQSTYYKTMSSANNRMLPVNFAPATEQLEKIRQYSSFFLSPEIARQTQARILPPPVLTPANPIVNVANPNMAETPPPVDDIELKQPVIIPKRTLQNQYGIIINDL